MPRAADLDTVAPDDHIISSPLPPRSPFLDKKLNQPKLVKFAKGNRKKKNIVNPNQVFRDRINDILGKTHHSLSSFLISPKVFTFEERDTEEEIILVLRRHWITNIGWIFITVFMALAPFIFSSVPLLTYFPPNYQFIALIFWYLITFVYSFEKFLSWYFNVCIITDERVVDIDFNNLLIKKFADAKISMIQDVSSHVIGVSQTLFNYGTVDVQTAAEVPEITFELIPNPEKVIKVLQQLRQEEEQEALEGRIR